MRRLFLALFLGLFPCASAKADNILAANCAVTPALCSSTPTNSGSLSLLALDYKGQVDQGYGPGAVYGTSINASHTLYDPTYGTTVSAALTVGFDGIHGSSNVSSPGDGGIARFNGQINDYFQVTGNVLSGTQLQVSYGADLLSNASLTNGTVTNHSYHSEGLQLNGTTCFNNLYYSGNFTGSCTGYIPISSIDHTARLSLLFFTELYSETSNVYLDASNTAKLNAITVVDAAGKPISGVQLYDASGYNYNAALPPATTPEPSSLFLLSTGLATVAGLARLRVARS